GVWQRSLCRATCTLLAARGALPEWGRKPTMRDAGRIRCCATRGLFHRCLIPSSSRPANTRRGEDTAPYPASPSLLAEVQCQDAPGPVSFRFLLAWEQQTVQ